MAEQLYVGEPKDGTYEMGVAEHHTGKLSDDPAKADGSSDNEDSVHYPPPYAGMGKEMVLHYSNTPAFNRARKILLMIFWGSWLIMIGAVIYLTVTHPRCKLKADIKWWHKASVYQIYPWSFRDSDGDGVGDINGIREKLSYLREINADAVWINPFYPHGDQDFGYDVSNYTDVDAQFGTMSDLEDLIAEMHEVVNGKDIKLIIDFIPNHTSNTSVWFEKSVQREEPFDEFYIWRDCIKNSTHFVPPNNWQSVVLGESAWTYNDVRQQCYLHQYQKSMPDLNFRNNRVKEAMDGVIKFWLDKDVDGIRIDAISKLYEDYSLRDELVGNPAADPNDYYGGYLNHTHTKNLPEINDMLNRWRGILDQYSSSRPRMMVAEASGTPEQLRMYYGRTKDGGADFPFNFQLTRINESCDGMCMFRHVDSWMANKPEEAPANWVLGNHDKPRIASRVGDDKLDAMNMLLLTLPGVATTYYGDEIGMLNINISNIESRDPIGKDDKSRSRDPQRSPMQWNANSTACHGFTSDCAKVWLPVHPEGDTINVGVERADSKSHLTVYKNLSKLRTEDTFTYGDFTVHVYNSNIYSFTRSFDGMSSYLVAVNIGSSSVEEDLSGGLPVTSATVSAVTGSSSYVIGAEVNLDNVSLKPGDGVVFTWPYVIADLI